MTVDEAIRLLDPKTTEQAFKEIKYYNGFNGKAAALEAFEDACILAADALRTNRNGGWISVKDRLPETERTVLCCSANGKAFVARYDFKWDRWRTSGTVDITYWIPLPEPPKEDTI